MSHYFTKCPDCGALLDPCEVCDCKKSAAPDAANIENGKGVETDTTIIADQAEKINPLAENFDLEELVDLIAQLILLLPEGRQRTFLEEWGIE